MHLTRLLPLLVSLLLTTSSAASIKKCRDESFRNPVLYEDYPDNDVSVGPDGAFYFSASNFHYSPGAPILRSLDLVNWEPVGHSIPRMNFGDGYNLPPGGERAYRGGTWASTLRYRKSDGLWYWIGCTNFWITWVFTAQSVEGPWYNRANFGGGNCMYDNGLLIDDDDTMYVVYGNGQVKVSQLAADGLSVVRTEQVLQASDVNTETVEGNRMYKINGTYYILNDQPGSTTYIWKSSSPWGPYEAKILGQNVAPPLEGGNSPHQGSLIQTAKGDWYFVSFTWAYPAGRMPVLAPIVWGEDGFPVLVRGSNGGWGSSYPLPLPSQPLYNWTRTYNFENELGPTWEWNHNPDVASYAVNNGVTLRTASVTEDLYSARNTLTHRIHGEFPKGTVEIDFSNLADGDRFGLAAFRDQSAYIGIHRSGSEYTLKTVHGIIIDEWSGAPVSPGREVASAPVPSGAKKVWFRAELDARPTGTRDANLFYSFDGTRFTKLGETYELYSGWAFFIAYRFGIFNFATKQLGGSVKVESFTAA
ncbi:glycosyl hydrolase family 43 protein [Colletotrichum tofieldiae]|uniref:Glycosyl hydrolase family 43 protein n=1 Tax=Colletotrichum tofieldiae TaxID=708197 RepID=A0A166VPL7_9PEZI|nr:glycosyl hydrolase family 43 protein [Colletotrichum tofieldiae]GKT56047.1 glycosyl hydrolase family 43 protein [Colletotrichum tofieldiae]GKT79121.1 glycosyl hydrolase family 43 protein [Colletotrichum tofieldiae]